MNDLIIWCVALLILAVGFVLAAGVVIALITGLGFWVDYTARRYGNTAAAFLLATLLTLVVFVWSPW
jgi:hypothetical protein